MLRFILCTIILCFSIVLKADVKSYYENTNNAELAICNGDYKKANQFYKKAFREHTPFLTDIYNAWLSAYYSKEKKVFERYLNLLLDRGLDKEELEKKELHEIRKSDFWTKKIQHKINQYVSSEKYNKKFIKEIKELIKKDQGVRKWCLNYNPSCVDSIKTIDSINYHKLISIYDRYDYPIEINSLDLGNSLMGKIIIGHNISWDRYWMDSILIEKVKEGKIYAKHAALILAKRGKEDVQRKGYIYTKAIFVSNTLFFPKELENKDYIKKVSQNRADLFLCNYDDYMRKLEFSLTQDKFIFYSAAYVDRLSGLPEQIIEEHIKPAYRIIELQK